MEVATDVSQHATVIDVSKHATVIDVSKHATGIDVSKHATGIDVSKHATVTDVSKHATDVSKHATVIDVRKHAMEFATDVSKHAMEFAGATTMGSASSSSTTKTRLPRYVTLSTGITVYGMNYLLVSQVTLSCVSFISGYEKLLHSWTIIPCPGYHFASAVPTYVPLEDLWSAYMVMLNCWTFLADQDFSRSSKYLLHPCRHCCS
jgi:hypothetical protein